MIPALFTRIWTVPISAETAAAMASTASWFDTSHATYRHLRPSARISRTVSQFAPSAIRSATTMSAPSLRQPQADRAPDPPGPAGNQREARPSLRVAHAPPPWDSEAMSSCPETEIGGRGPIDAPHQTGQHLAGTHLDEPAVAGGKHGPDRFLPPHGREQLPHEAAPDLVGFASPPRQTHWQRPAPARRDTCTARQAPPRDPWRPPPSAANETLRSPRARSPAWPRPLAALHRLRDGLHLPGDHDLPRRVQIGRYDDAGHLFEDLRPAFAGSRPRIAAIVPGRSSPALNINSPRRRTSRRPSSKLIDPAAT